jgi:hypothetical protein
VRNVTIDSVSLRLGGVKSLGANFIFCFSFMELDFIIEVDNLLPYIQDTIAAWNPDEVEGNGN